MSAVRIGPVKRYVQYGCGFSAPLEWVNYDASPTLRFEKFPLIGRLYTRNNQRFPSNVLYGDIVKGLPETNESCEGIYCSHILEHLSYTDFKKALSNTYRILKPGGLFRCVVPDLKQAAINYLASYDHEPAPAHQFLKNTMLGASQRVNDLPSLAKSFLGNSKHLWMWDEKTLAFELKKVGFLEIRNCIFNDSTDTRFSFVEEEGRFYQAVAIECRK